MLMRRTLGLQRLDRAQENLLDESTGVDLAQQSSVAVVLDQGSRLLLVRLDPLPHDVLPVVRADDEGRPAFVADPAFLRRIREYVIHRVVFRAYAPARVPLDQLLGLEEVADDRIELRELQERLGLAECPG